jgi:ABC-type multidrug transport system fused ATPase/permease subunit
MQRFENVKIVQAFNRFRYEDSRLTAEIKNLIGLNMKNVVYASSTRNISFLIMSLGPIIIFGWGGHQVIKGAVTLGTLVAFLQYLRRLFIPLRDLMEVYVELVKASVSMRRVVEFLEIPVPVDEADKSGDVSFEDTITFRDVDFGYNEQRILDQFNFEIEKGRRYALVGPSGCGKSTIVNLLCGFYKPGNGTILIDDRPLNDLDLAGWREQIALVPQDDHLFREPIWKNIQYGNLNSTPGEVENVMHLVGLPKQPKFMKKGKQGTVEGTIGDRGRTLSGGIKQRIAIARAMLKEADLLIMDEATSQLDSESEKRILDNIKERSPGLTLLLISHRMAVIRDMDEIIYMDRGKVMEKGSHKELMAKKGFYWTFFKEQIQD